MCCQKTDARRNEGLSAQDMARFREEFAGLMPTTTHDHGIVSYISILNEEFSCGEEFAPIFRGKLFVQRKPFVIMRKPVTRIAGDGPQS
jgi:hypothetical protein